MFNIGRRDVCLKWFSRHLKKVCGEGCVTEAKNKTKEMLKLIIVKIKHTE